MTGRDLKFSICPSDMIHIIWMKLESTFISHDRPEIPSFSHRAVLLGNGEWFPIDNYATAQAICILEGGLITKWNNYVVFIMLFSGKKNSFISGKFS